MEGRGGRREERREKEREKYENHTTKSGIAQGHTDTFKTLLTRSYSGH